MLTQSLSTLTRAALAAAVLSVASNAAIGCPVFSLTANPFPVNAISDLHSATPVFIDGGTGVGVIGSTSDFYVKNYQQTFSDFTGGNQTLRYSADLVFTLTDAGGASLGPITLHSDNFGAVLTGRGSDTQTGTFAQALVQGSYFSGTVGGQNLKVELNPLLTSAGSVTINPASGGFAVTNNKNINPQYIFGTNDPIVVPTLNASFVPEPATALLMVPGLLAMGIRRRTAHS